MALAAASQNHHHHKIKQNSGFSPPSQIMSNYANFGPATSNPYWHHNVRNNPFHFIHNNPDYHHHFHKLPESQQQIMPTVHPSVLTPFLEQVHLKQKEAAATADQKNSQKQSHELSSNENSGSYEVINDVFSKHLVPPPPSQQSPINYKPKPEKQEKMKTFNLSMPSPLQDASRFNYNNVISTATPTNDNLWFKPSASDNNYFTTERPNVFVHLNNRTKENVYKQHKLLHPSYTGGLKKKPFLPTPYRPDKEEEPLRIDYEPQHSFFTIEDAVTPNIPAYQVIKSHIPVEEEPELITYEPIRQYDLHRKPDYDYSATIAPTLKPSTTTASPVESTQKPRQKLRRRKPRPQQKQQQQQQQEQQKQEQQQQQFIETTASDERVKFTVKPNRVRGSIKNVDTQTEQNELKTRNRLNHPNRVRNRLNFSSPAATLSTADYDSTVRTSTEEEKKNDVPTTQQASTESVVLKLEESSERPENVKRRVKLRLKNKLRLNPNINSLESTETRQKLNDNQILDTENVVVKNDETTELSFGTESGLNELRTSLKLPNLKLRNEALTTLPTTADTVSTSMQPSSTTTAEHEENSVLNKINNRPRFSIKEYKRKPLSTTSTATTLLSSATAATTVKPDGQRFNRLRVNLRRRNETSDSGEEEFPRKRYSTTRTTTTTTEAPTQTSSLPRRAPLPKRTFPARNFTKPTINLNEVESTTTNLKPSIKNTTSFVSNRPSSPNLRSRIQYKKKEPTNEVADSSNNFIKTINFSSEAAVTHESTPSSTTSTESPYRETSIMKIAKTPPSVNLEKSTTDDFTDFSVTSDNISRNDFDLTGASSEHSQRVADLTIGTHGGSDSYSFKSANLGPLTRRIPNYFTISTDDPILPIQAFFPQIKTNENVS